MIATFIVEAYSVELSSSMVPGTRLELVQTGDAGVNPTRLTMTTMDYVEATALIGAMRNQTPLTVTIQPVARQEEEITAACCMYFHISLI